MKSEMQQAAVASAGCSLQAIAREAGGPPPYPQAAAHGACGPGTHLQVGPVEGVEEAGGDRGDVLAQRGDRGADKRLAYTQEALAPLNHLRQ